MKILVATHKDYQFPKSQLYLPIQVGKVLSNQNLGIIGDDTGQHISEKNGSFCELTALYWAWKNNYFKQFDIIGLVHYRRYFQGKEIHLNDHFILGNKEIVELLNQFDCILPRKRNYYIETVYSHYANAHYIQDLDKVRDILTDKHPDYLAVYDQVMQGKTLHLFNMFIMRSELCEQYCQWLFPILFELEKKIDISAYSHYQKRVFGFIAERLLNVWVLHHLLKIKEVKVENLEKEPIFIKAFHFLKRKLLRNGKK